MAMAGHAGRTDHKQSHEEKQGTALHRLMLLRYRSIQVLQKRFRNVAAAAVKSIDSGEASGSAGTAVEWPQK